LGCGEARDWDSERRATHIIHADSAAELHAVRFTAMFAANTDFQIAAAFPATFDSNFNQLPDSGLIE
jgi:hypothetical protein